MPPAVRIVSLVPHATELLFALGLGDAVVGVTHECDHPPDAVRREHVTRDLLPAGLDAAAIDAAVAQTTQGGDAIYALDEAKVAALRPDLIVTQALCPVCAVSHDDVVRVAEGLESCPRVLALDPTTFGETLADVRTVAEATDRIDEGLDLVRSIAARVERVERAVRGATPVPVACLEWLDPVWIGGHWVPQLVEMAGGLDVLGLPGEPSTRSTWEEVAAGAPEVVLSTPCGFGLERAVHETRAQGERIAALGARRVVAVDASATFSRPGPRLVDGLEVLAHVLHPDRVPAPSGAAWADVELPAAARR